MVIGIFGQSISFANRVNGGANLLSQRFIRFTKCRVGWKRQYKMEIEVYIYGGKGSGSRRNSCSLGKKQEIRHDPGYHQVLSEYSVYFDSLKNN